MNVFTRNKNCLPFVKVSTCINRKVYSSTVLSLLCLIFLSAFLKADTASAAGIVSVQSINIKPYNNALNAFESSCSCKVDRYIISEMYGDSIVDTLNSERPDLIVAVGRKALEDIREIRDVPVVSIMTLNPLRIAPDNNNIAGIDLLISPDILISEITGLIPHVKSLGLIYAPSKSGTYVDKAIKAAEQLNIKIVAQKVRNRKEIHQLLNSMKSDIDALWMIPDITLSSQSALELLSLFSIENNIPIITFSKNYFKVGALLSFDINPAEMGRQAWKIADKILSGAEMKKGEIYYAENVSISVNKKIVENFGLVTVDNMLIKPVATNIE